MELLHVAAIAASTCGNYFLVSFNNGKLFKLEYCCREWTWTRINMPEGL